MAVPRTPDELNARDREHYEVAKALVGWFTGSDFRDRYRRMYPQRNTGSILPSDYCINRHNKGNASYPRFLEWDNDRSHRFVDLKTVERTTSAPPTPLPPAPVPAVQTRSHRATSRAATVLFTPAPGRSLVLNADTATRAITAYNSDREVLGQEERAFEMLGSGLHRGRVLEQLRALDAAYRTRSVGADLAKIAATIEERWTDWSGLLMAVRPLSDEIPPPEIIGPLMRFFLASGMRRSPRSLAAKALHFAQPLAFIPADSYAVDKLGEELDAGSWSDTDGLGAEGMAAWYASYLQVIHDIGAVNPGLVGTLHGLDQKTGDRPAFNRLRGLPKLMDKILWWAGREERRGATVNLFQRV